MKQMMMTGTLAAVVCVTMGLAGGCGPKQNDPMAMNADVTNISAIPPATPLALEPAAAPLAQPVVSDVPTQAPASAVEAPTGGTYTVQKGDTLWKIAMTSYGNGNQWQRIASANPGLSPSTLKVGQTITVP